LVADEDSVYLTVLSRIYSYNLRNGQQNWETESKGTHRGHFLSFGKRGLYEYEYPARDGNVIRQFDPQTGEILTVDMLPLQNPPILALLDDFYLGETDAGLWAIERETNKVLWHVSGLGIDLSKPVILINDSLIITNNGYLLVLSVDTGEIIWQQPNIASNAVVLESFVYVMMTDANIRAYDLVDGHEVGIIQIEPHMTYLTEGGGNHALEVNPQDRMIYVYYADSQEIIALGQ
jgi:outer membrane protein assembly factor BamB